MEKAGSRKDPNSIRSLGLTQILLDKPLKRDIKGLAADRGVTMVAYLRSLVDPELGKGSQRVLPMATEVSDPEFKDELAGISRAVYTILDYTSCLVAGMASLAGASGAEVMAKMHPEDNEKIQEALRRLNAREKGEEAQGDLELA